LPKNQRNKLLEVSGIGIQMGVTIYLGAHLGMWLDEKYPSERRWFTMLFTLVAVALSLYNILKQVEKLDD